MNINLKLIHKIILINKGLPRYKMLKKNWKTKMKI